MVGPSTTGGGARSSLPATHRSMRRSNSAHNIAKQRSQRQNQHDLRQNMEHKTIESQLWTQENRQQSENSPDPLPTPGRHPFTEPSELGIPEDEADIPDEELVLQSQQSRGRGRLSQIREQCSIISAISSHNQPDSRSKAQPQDTDHSIIEFSRPHRAFTFNSETSAMSNDSSMPHDSRWSSNTTIPAIGPSSRASTFQTDIPSGESLLRNPVQSVGLRQFLFKKEGRPTPRAPQARPLTPERDEADPVSAASPDPQKHLDPRQETRAMQSPECPGPALPAANPPSDACHKPEVADDDIIEPDKDDTSTILHEPEVARVLSLPDEHLKSIEISDCSKISSVRSESSNALPPACQASHKTRSSIGRLIRKLGMIRLKSAVQHIISATRGKETSESGGPAPKSQKTARKGHHARSKRPRVQDDQPPADEDDEGDGSKRHRPSSGNKEPDLTKCLSYKCLYYAYNPTKFSACEDHNSLWTITRLKQHLRRYHTYHCRYCEETFGEDHPRKESHEQKRALHVAGNVGCGPDLPSASEKWEDMSESQKDRLHQRDAEDDSSWQTLFEFFFSTKRTHTPSSAYFDGPISMLIRREVPMIVDAMLDTLPQEAEGCSGRIEQWLQATLPTVLHRLTMKVQLNNVLPSSSGNCEVGSSSIYDHQVAAMNGQQAPFVGLPPSINNDQQFLESATLPAGYLTNMTFNLSQAIPNYNAVMQPQLLAPGQPFLGHGVSGRNLDDPASSAASIRSGSSAYSSAALKASQVPSVACTDPTEYTSSQQFQSAPDLSNYQFPQSQHLGPANFTIPPPHGSSFMWTGPGTGVEPNSQPLGFHPADINHMQFSHGPQERLHSAPEVPLQPPYKNPGTQGYPPYHRPS